MMKSVRDVCAMGLLAATCLSWGCTRQTGSDTPAQPASSALEPGAAAAPSGSSVGAVAVDTRPSRPIDDVVAQTPGNGVATQTPEGAGACECGPLLLPPQAGCAAEAWFCNPDHECACHPGWSRLPDIQAPPGSGATLARRAAATSSATQPTHAAAPASSAAAPTTRAVAPTSSVAAPRAGVAGPSSANTGENFTNPGAPGCMCAAGSVTAPQGSCPDADWYCNASARCRCAL